MSEQRTLIAGVGSWLPDQIVTSATIEERFGLAAGWCEKRVGVAERRRAEPRESSVKLGAHAARRALNDAGVSAADVDYVLFHTTYPEYLYPTPGVFLQGELDLPSTVPVLEVKAACTAWLAMVQLGDALLRAGSAACVLVVCGERVHDGSQENGFSAPLFGDAGGAAVLRLGAPGAAGGLRYARVYTEAAAGGRCLAAAAPLAFTDPSAAAELEPALEHWAEAETAESGIRAYWDGVSVFRNAVRCMGRAINEALTALELDTDDVDHYFVHQANAKILRSLTRQSGLPASRVHSNILTVGNTASASLPVLLREVMDAGRVLPGERLLFAAFGAGYTYGALVYEVPA